MKRGQAGMGRRIVLSIASILSMIPGLTEARVTELVIDSVESPTFEGLRFGSVGRYERLVGHFKGELDPTDPLNSGIVNLDKAPRNARGFVEYEADLYLFKPIDMQKGNGRILYSVPNRSFKTANLFLNSGPVDNDPHMASDVGTGFLMREGYTIVWSGWQMRHPVPGQGSEASPADYGGGIFARLPVATQDGEPIVGTSREEFIPDKDAATHVGNLSYPAADLKPASASLTIRQKQSDARQAPEDLSWRYLNESQIEITRPEGFDAGAIYEFIYPAKDPVVYGIAFASIRDILSFLRYEIADQTGRPNPLSGDERGQSKDRRRPAVDKVLAVGVSQAGRFLRSLIHEGFNEDEAHRQVIDGAMPTIAGSRRNWTNFEFALPGTWSRQHETHYQRGDQFPFTYPVLHDPISGKTDGILATCRRTKTCPKIMHVDTDAEMYQARASLVVTDTSGNDIDLPAEVRAYLFAAAQHSAGGPIDRGICQNFRNPLDYRPFMRALLVALDEWVSEGIEPPPSQFPSRSDGTLVASDETGFPVIPGVAYEGLYNSLRLTDYSVQPPAEEGAYPVFLSAVDSDGNPVAGILPVEVEVPLGTFAGWNLRAPGFAEGELCHGDGSYLPFAKTESERAAADDPRPSIESRYPDHGAYVREVSRAVRRLVNERFLRREDAWRITSGAAEGSSWDELVPIPLAAD